MKLRLGLIISFMILYLAGNMFACENSTLYIYDDFSNKDQDLKWEISQSYAEPIDPPSNWKTKNSDGIWEITGTGYDSEGNSIKYTPKKFIHQIRSLKIKFKISSESDDSAALRLFSVPYSTSYGMPVGITALIMKYRSKAYFAAFSELPVGTSMDYLTKWYADFDEYIDLDKWYIMQICSDSIGNIFFGIYEKDGTIISALSDDISSYLGDFHSHTGMETMFVLNFLYDDIIGKIRVDIDDVYIDHKSSHFTAEDIQEAYDQGYSEALAGSDCDPSQNPEQQCISTDNTFDLDLPCVQLGVDRFQVVLNHNREANAWSLGEIIKLEKAVE